MLGTKAVALGLVQSFPKRSVLIVDPYLDERALFDFVPVLSERVEARLLADSNNGRSQDSLQTGVRRWVAQYGDARPLEARATAPRTLHDRLIIIDDGTAWVLSQSLKDFAARSPASLTKTDPEVGQLKVDAYQAILAAAAVL